MKAAVLFVKRHHQILLHRHYSQCYHHPTQTTHIRPHKKKVCEASLCDPSANSISHSAPRQKVIFSLILLSLLVLKKFGSTYKIFRSEEKEVFPLMLVLPRLHCTGCHSGLNISLQRMKQHRCDSDYSVNKKKNTTKPEKKMSDNCTASCCRLYM